MIEIKEGGRIELLGYNIGGVVVREARYLLLEKVLVG